MTENKEKIVDKTKDKDKKTEGESNRERHQEPETKDKHLVESKTEKKTAKEQQSNKSEHTQHSPQQQPAHNQHDRGKRLSQFLDMLNIPRHHHQQQHQHPYGSHSSGSSNTSQQHSPQTPFASIATTGALTNTTCHLTVTSSSTNNNNKLSSNSNNHKTNNINTSNNHTTKLSHHLAVVGSSSSEEQEYLSLPNAYLPRSSCVSFQSEILLLDLINGEINELYERTVHKDDFGTQRVYKKTSPNCVLTLYLPSREITLSGSSPSILRGIVFVDPKAIQGHRVYAQLTLTFRYGREDEEVMGLRFCNEAIMSLHQIWPRNEEPSKESLSPLQEALLKRLGEGAHPFTLTLTAQAPPSVQLVPAKRYYGAPIGTSYDVRCFIANRSDEKFHRRAAVKMGVRVIYRTDVFNQGINGPENFATLVNNPVNSPPLSQAPATQTTANVAQASVATSISTTTTISSDSHNDAQQQHVHEGAASAESSLHAKVRKSERGESFPKLRLSPKTFRFSNRFGRSKSEVEKCPSDPFHNYSKSFQEYDSVCATNLSGGPQGAVDKPFLLQDGRVSLRASLDKSWYTHGENVCVTINIRNDSRKTVRKIRVCAIQHVDVCMFNNGKFKNVVADSDSVTPPPIDQQVAPGTTLNTSVILKPQRGATKNWIALEDTLQRSTEPDEITADIAASALRTPHFLMQANHSPNKCSSPGVLIPPTALTTAVSHAATNSDERNVFAIYVSYYIKVKLTLSGMGGELSLKLPFLLVHIDEEQRLRHEKENIILEEVPANKRNGKLNNKSQERRTEMIKKLGLPSSLERIESLDTEDVHIKVTQVSSCEGDGVVETTIPPVHKTAADGNDDDIFEEPQPSTSLACRRRRQSFMRCESIDQGLEDDVEIAKSIDLQKILHAAQVHTESQNEPEPTLENNAGLKSRENVGLYGKT